MASAAQLHMGSFASVRGAYQQRLSQDVYQENNGERTGEGMTSQWQTDRRDHRRYLIRNYFISVSLPGCLKAELGLKQLSALRCFVHRWGAFFFFFCLPPGCIIYNSFSSLNRRTSHMIYSYQIHWWLQVDTGHHHRPGLRVGISG